MSSVVNDPKIIVALDFVDIESTRQLVACLSPEYCRLKVGNILFTKYGPALVEELMKQGFDIFLDLKFHDIPQTVARACHNAASMGVWMTNVHVQGGQAMLTAASEAVAAFQQAPLLIGVTVLTSLDNDDCLRMGIKRSLADLVVDMACLAEESGLDGVVCSSQEVALIRHHLKDFVLVTPGIRLAHDAVDDQKRVMTPQQALQEGASYLVMGRSIYRATDPNATLIQISQQMQEA